MQTSHSKNGAGSGQRGSRNLEDDEEANPYFKKLYDEPRVENRIPQRLQPDIVAKVVARPEPSRRKSRLKVDKPMPT